LKAHRVFYHSIPGLRVIKKKKKKQLDRRQYFLHQRRRGHVPPLSCLLTEASRLSCLLTEAGRPTCAKSMPTLCTRAKSMPTLSLSLALSLALSQPLLHQRRRGHVPPPFNLRHLLHINVQRFRGGLVFKAHRLFYHSTLGLRAIKKKKKQLDRRQPLLHQRRRGHVPLPFCEIK